MYIGPNITPKTAAAVVKSIEKAIPSKEIAKKESQTADLFKSAVGGGYFSPFTPIKSIPKENKTLGNNIDFRF